MAYPYQYIVFYNLYHTYPDEDPEMVDGAIFSYCFWVGRLTMAVRR